MVSRIQLIESRIQSVESRIQSVKYGIQTTKYGIQSVESRIQSVESGIQIVESGIQSTESGFQSGKIGTSLWILDSNEIPDSSHLSLESSEKILEPTQGKPELNRRIMKSVTELRIKSKKIRIPDMGCGIHIVDPELRIEFY